MTYREYDDYVRMYDKVNYIDKVVLDIGASYHTPEFFISKGAKYVIAVEPNNEIFFIYDETKVTHLSYFITCSEQIENLILKYKPDVVKLDCEGCELELLYVDDEILKIPEWYVFECHPGIPKYFLPNDPQIYWPDKLEEKFVKIGFEIIDKQEIGTPFTLFTFRKIL